MMSEAGTVIYVVIETWICSDYWCLCCVTLPTLPVFRHLKKFYKNIKAILFERYFLCKSNLKIDSSFHKSMTFDFNRNIQHSEMMIKILQPMIKWNNDYIISKANFSFIEGDNLCRRIMSFSVFTTYSKKIMT